MTAEHSFTVYINGEAHYPLTMDINLANKVYEREIMAHREPPFSIELVDVRDGKVLSSYRRNQWIRDQKSLEDF